MDVAYALDLFLRLLAAALAGVALGVPTEARRLIGGIRTHAMVSLGAALFCLTAARASGQPAEIVRVIAGVATGIGFVGAATVVRRRGLTLGITTAASIWVSGAVGCEIGAGSPLVGLALAVVVALLNVALLVAQRRLGGRRLRGRRLGPHLPGVPHARSTPP